MMTEPLVSTQRFSTAAYAPRDSIQAWRELYGHTIAQLDFEPVQQGELIADATVRRLPGLGLVSMASTELRFRKPRNLIDNDDLILLIVDRGYWTGSQLGREVRLETGDAVLCSNAAVARGAAFGRRVMFRVPYHAVASELADVRALISRRIPRDAEGLKLLRQYLQSAQDGELLTNADLQRLIVAHVYDLMTLTLAASRRDTAMPDTSSVRAARMRAIKDDIARSLGRVDLSVAAIARRHAVTARYIQFLFEGEGTTFTDHVLGERLARAHRMLTDPQRAGEKVATIAFEVGFGDLSYFNQVFRRRYGAAPSDVRAHLRRAH